MAGRPALIPPEQAQAVLERFAESYEALGSPRVLIYVNRELVDQTSGWTLATRNRQTQTIRGDVTREFEPATNAAETAPPATPTDISGSVIIGDVQGGSPAPGTNRTTGQVEKISERNTFRARAPKEFTLADRQTVRDVERLFGRPLRMAGVSLVDQRLATQLIGDKPVESFATPTEGEQARKDREAISNIADVVLEVLVGSRQVVTREVSGDQTYTVPDIQATAIRLSDSKILGQATASDLLGPDRFAARVARQFDMNEITEATALALMEDIALTQ